MAEKLYCAHCDLEFEPEGADRKPRCPNCMRQGGVKPVGVQTEPAGANTKRLLGLSLVLIAGMVAYAAYRASEISLEETPPLRPLESRELAAYLERDQISVGRFDGMFVLTGQGDWPQEPTALAASIHDKAERWGLDRPLSRDAWIADEALGALQSGDATRVYPLESAVAMTALLREQGVRAMVVETWDLGEQSPPDPSGRFGYFLVATFDGDAQDPSAYFDPWGGRKSVSPRQSRVMRDTEVLAAALGTDAIRTFVKSGDGAQSLPLVETALLLDPVSPSLRGVHGTVLLETGGVAAGTDELDAARELRPDGPRELNLVQLLLAKAAMLQMSGQEAAAETQLNAASQTIDSVISQAPRYSRAYMARAMLHFGINEPERARDALEIAQSLTPSSAVLWSLWAQYYLALGDTDSAAARARRAVELDPDNWQQRVQVARVLVEAGDTEAAEAQVDAAIALVPPAKQE
ncbi:MAG: tetratricopeptide repeat protein, partial [Polyangiales bacterium]